MDNKDNENNPLENNKNDENYENQTEEDSRNSAEENDNDDEEYDTDIGTDFSDLDIDVPGKEIEQASSGSEESENEEGVENEYSTDSSEDELSEKCPICLRKFTNQEIGVPETCEHHFCLKCISEWSKKVATCPIDRNVFPSILVKREFNGEVLRFEEVEIRNLTRPVEWELYDTDPTYCEICGNCDREDRLLLCDGCDLGYHLECLDPPLEFVPIEDWFCSSCVIQRDNEASESAVNRNSISIRVPRTGQTRRLLESIRRRVVDSINSIQTSGRSSSKPATKRKTKKIAKRKVTSKTKRGVKSKSRGRKRKVRRGKRGNKKRVVIDRRPLTTKSRLAQHLGILPPRAGQKYIGLPPCRSSSSNGVSNFSSSSRSYNSLNSLRYSAGITPLRIYGTSHDLADCIESFSDDEAGVSVGTARPHSFHHLESPIKGQIQITSSTSIRSSSEESTNDVLGSILRGQYLMLKDRNMQINRDGTLTPSISLPKNIQVTTLFNNETVSFRKKDFNKDNENDTSGYDSSPRRIPEYGLYRPNFEVDHHLNSQSISNINNTNRHGIRQAPLSPHFNDSSVSNTSNSSNRNHNVDDSQGASLRQPTQTNYYSGSSNVNQGGANFTSFGNDPNESKNSNNDMFSLSGFNENESLLNANKKQKLKNQQQDKRNDNDDDFNIYSDIEEENKICQENIEEKQKKKPEFSCRENEKASSISGESESDMVIDEELILSKDTVDSSSKNQKDKVETNYLAPETNLNLLESIPLPAETPSQSLNLNESCQENKSRSTNKEEYDPSQPLNSSDEEEEEEIANNIFTAPDNILSSSTKENKDIERAKDETNKISTLSPSKNDTVEERIQKYPEPENFEFDISSIPMPPPPTTDEYRRPTIQFSIPSRHRLVPISTLMKRQKGVAKKENKNSFSFQSEISKAFGGSDENSHENDESDEYSLEKNLEDDRDKHPFALSEIFGSDDEDEAEAEQNDQTTKGSQEDTIENKKKEKENENLDKNNIEQNVELSITEEGVKTKKPLAEIIANRWKKIVEDETVEDISVIATITNESNNAEPISNECVIVQEVAHVYPRGNIDDEVIVEKLVRNKIPVKTPTSTPRNEQIVKNKSEQITPFESISEDSEIESSLRRSKKLEHVEKYDKNINHFVTPKNTKSLVNKEKEKDRKNFKRKRSGSSQSNCEEGEIIDSPEKRRRKGKKKKTKKKRKRSRDSMELSGKDDQDEANNQESSNHQSSDEEEENNNNNNHDKDSEFKSISWRKPSKSNKERNYRDGKPKSDESYFREKEKERKKDSKDSPRHRERSRDKEKSPLIVKEKSDRDKPARDERRKRSNSRNTYERSASQSLYWKSNNSKSRSVSKSRLKEKRIRSKSNSSRTYRSRSRSLSNSRSAHTRRRRRNSFSSPKRFRSSRRSRSKSPLRKRERRKSRSTSRSRKNRVRKKSTGSTCSSRSSSKRNRKRGERISRKKKEKDSRDKIKDIRNDKSYKEKEKVVQPSSTSNKDQQVNNVTLEKDKKKKRKKKEKSVSPAKAIFADGDSIVVSLNFQKKDQPLSEKNNEDNSNKNTTGGNDDVDGKRHRDGKKKNGKNVEKEGSEGGSKAKVLKKTVLIDLESSPIVEQKIGVSPTLIVLSDDDNNNENKSKGLGNTIDSENLNSSKISPPYHRHIAPADSTQIQQNESTKLDGSCFYNALDDQSPSREGDSLITSTRESTEGALLPEEDNDSMSLSSPSPPDKSNDKAHSPVAPKTPPLPPNSPPKQTTIPPPPHLTNGSHHHHHHHHQQQQQQNQSQSQINKPFVVGNIPLFSGNSNLPSSVMIPTPPAPNLRFGSSTGPFNQTMLNPNVIASMASALFAVRQQQQNPISKIAQSTSNPNVIANKIVQPGSVLLPKNQNTAHHHHGPRSGNGGESPFSPNSSEGDDLFEPPKDCVHNSESGQQRDGKLTEKPGPTSGNANSNSSSGPNSGTPVKSKSNLFDSLFGTPPASQNKMAPTGQLLNKPHDKTKFINKGKHNHSPHKNKLKVSTGGKKEISKLTEGELRLTDEVPTSAVELRVKEKFLKKLNRQERVVEEVKLSLKPHYSKKHVTKDEYKEILRRAVPKICHNKSGEINPFKIKELVEAYVKKFRHGRSGKKD